MTEEPIEICGKLAHPRFLQANKLTPCLRKPGHKSPHVYYLHIREGVDHSSSSSEYLEEIRRKQLKPIAHVSLRGKEPLTDEEAAAILAYLEIIAKQREVLETK